MRKWSIDLQYKWKANEESIGFSTWWSTNGILISKNMTLDPYFVPYKKLMDHLTHKTQN